MSSSKRFNAGEQQRRSSGPNSQTPSRQASGHRKPTELVDWRTGNTPTLEPSLSLSPTPSGEVVRPWRQQGGRNSSLAQVTPARGKSNTQDSPSQIAVPGSSQSSGGVPLYPEEASNALQLRSASHNAFNDHFATAELHDNQNEASQPYQVILIFLLHCNLLIGSRKCLTLKPLKPLVRSLGSQPVICLL
jgi:hypothetical protein